MQKANLQKAKGVRDFSPQEKILRNQITDTLREVFESFGYNPIETPILERYDFFASKFGIGKESDAMRETFKLSDQGGRDLVLRTELTMPFARFIASNPQFKLPFKRYQIGEVFRDGPLKTGRYREFWQCDIDAVGLDAPGIDVEMIKIIDRIFARLKLPVVIKLNNRKILNELLREAGVDQKLFDAVIISIDKLDKIGEKGVAKELKEKGLSQKQIDFMISALNVKGGNSAKINSLKNILRNSEGLQEIKSTLELAKVTDLQFAPELARGLAYYTGNVIEVFLKDQKILGSALCGGGRYDNMIAGIIGSSDIVPAIGISFGLDTIFDAITLKNKKARYQKSVTNLYISPMEKLYLPQAFELAEYLREKGVNSDIDYACRKLKKSFDYANSYDIPWVLVIGENEIKSKKYALKNMDKGSQYFLTRTAIAKKIIG